MPPLSRESSFVSCGDESSCSSVEDSLETVCENCKPLHEQHALQRPRRNVRFAESDDVVKTTHKDDMTEDEKDSTWLSYEEIRAMKMDCVVLVGMLEDGMADMLQEEDDVDLCLRGLEQHSGERHQRKTVARRQIYKDISTIQSFSSFQGFCNAGLIAEVSRRGSEQLSQEARELGRSDALFVATLG